MVCLEAAKNIPCGEIVVIYTFVCGNVWAIVRARYGVGTFVLKFFMFTQRKLVY